MARDYKDTWNKKSSARTAVAGWVWLVGGLAIGLFIAFLVWLDKRPAVSSGSVETRQTTETATTKKTDDAQGRAQAKGSASVAGERSEGFRMPGATKNKVDPKPGTKSDKAAATQKPRFDFYTILPEMEVIVPTKETKSHARPVGPGSYFLQAGSFKNMADADTLKARLALLGMEAKIESVTVEDDTWYRVRLGPFKDMDQLNKMLGELRQNNINALPVRVKS